MEVGTIRKRRIGLLVVANIANWKGENIGIQHRGVLLVVQTRQKIVATSVCYYLFWFFLLL